MSAWGVLIVTDPLPLAAEALSSGAAGVVLGLLLLAAVLVLVAIADRGGRRRPGTRPRRGVRRRPGARPALAVDSGLFPPGWPLRQGRRLRRPPIAIRRAADG